MTIAILDGDIISYSCAIYNENWGWERVVHDMDALIKRILEEGGADDYEIYISGGNNFRYDIYPEYKANRKDTIDPRYRQDANAYLVTEFAATVTDGYEADDALGIAATKYGDRAVICTIDKDLLQVPGNHYNWRKNIHTTVSPLDGLRSFYRQIIMGDRTDNIFGVKGLGEVKSGRIINDLTDETDMFQAVQMLYDDDTRLLMNGRCLYILREEGVHWRFPEIAESQEDGEIQE